MGRRLATARQAQSSGRTTGDRPRQTRSRAGGGRRRGKASGPRDGEPPTRHAAQPARRDRRTHNVRSRRPVGKGRQSWPAPRAKARGVGAGARGAPPLPPPKPNLEGRGGEGPGGKRDTTHPRETTPPTRPGVSLPLPPFFPFPSRAARVEERLASRAGRGHRAALGTDHVNDPSAGSPTETLLRLLLPLDSQVRPSSQRSARAVGRPRRGRSEGLTKPSNR